MPGYTAEDDLLFDGQQLASSRRTRLMGPDPAVALCRWAVRAALRGQPVGRSILVACSGGADSTALAAATAFEAGRSGRVAGLVTVDHGLQANSADLAAWVAIVGYELGFDPVLTMPVTVSGPGGPEAAARAARYRALSHARLALGPQPALLLLGHTADDQAETVLLGLGRGSGARALAGMRSEREGVLRPFLALRRADTEAACAALGLPVFADPHNADDRFRRVRVRRELLPLMNDVLAGGVVEALCRTAEQLQADTDALDGMAHTLTSVATCGDELAIAALADQPQALISRVIKLWVERCTGRALTAAHVNAVRALVSDWHGQAPISVPGGASVAVRSGRLVLLPGGNCRGTEDRTDSHDRRER